ncbi:MAG: YbaY family lipoprotein [Xanthomonadales bacterium]|jgi:putative lipoprotein|nr:YbaY family lipoprotein [Xanthomonadales bacterium]
MRIARGGALAALGLLVAVVVTGCGGEEAAVSPEPASATLTGTVTYRERMALPVNATIDVRLLDISLQDAPARVLAQQTIEAAGQSVPIPFALDYAPGLVQDRLTFAVRAEIRSADGELLWTTDTVHPVLTRGAPKDGVEIRLVRAGG